MSAKVLIGTSGFSYNDWVGPFYPTGTAPKDYLQLYAQEFDFTELNFTYYRQPDKRQTCRMATVTSPAFRFAVKAHQSLTHHIEAGAFADEAATFKAGIAPLYESGKLGMILFQFPYSFSYVPDNRTYLKKLLDEFGGFPCSIEFRNQDWQKPQVYDGLRSYHAGVVNVDEPALPGLLKPDSMITSHTGYVRFHGRNSANWWNGDNVSRYDYLYSVDDLKEWIPRIAVMVKLATVVMIAFNNHARGQAIINARMMKEMIKNCFI